MTLFLMPLAFALLLQGCSSDGVSTGKPRPNAPRLLPPQIRLEGSRSGIDHPAAKLEPSEGKVFHGAQAEVRPSGLSRRVDWDGLENYTRATGRRPKLIMHYTSFDPFAFALLKPTIDEIAEQPYDYIPQIGLDFYSYFPAFDILRPNDITAEIAQGQYDSKIRQLAQSFISMACPVFLRPGYEFGGNGQGRHASRVHWIRAWRRIHDLFREEGAQKVAFVWNTLDAGDYMKFYPGDRYVDWWAINIFSNHPDRDRFIHSFVQDAARRGKPVMIAESTPRYVGSTGGRTSWVDWYEPFFNLIKAHPNIKAFCYINASWHGYPDPTFSRDCRIQSDPYVRRKYQEALQSPRFIHAERK